MHLNDCVPPDIRTPDSHCACRWRRSCSSGITSKQSQKRERSAIVDCLDRLWSDLGVAVVPCVRPDSHESLHTIGVVILPPLDIVHHHARRIPRDLAEHRRHHLNTQHGKNRQRKNSGKAASNQRNHVKHNGNTAQKQRQNRGQNSGQPVQQRMPGDQSKLAPLQSQSPPS